MSAAIEMLNAGRRFGRRWALEDCTLTIPQNRVVGLVGSNGAGKTTLLHLVVGLLKPTTGSVHVLGQRSGTTALLSQVGFVAQDTPLYKSFSVAETLSMGAWLNPRWDKKMARDRLVELDIPFAQRVGGLSGGQRAQLALTLALAKRPQVLLLDEPVANLDPLGRRNFLRMVLANVAETGMTVILSSHLIGDLERTCDHIVLLSSSRVQLNGDVDGILGQHLVLTGPRSAAAVIARDHTIVQEQYTDRHANLLVRARGPIHDPSWTARPANLEELVLAYMSEPEYSDIPIQNHIERTQGKAK